MHPFAPSRSSLFLWTIGSAGLVDTVWSVVQIWRAARQLPDRNEDFVLTEHALL